MELVIPKFTELLKNDKKPTFEEMREIVFDYMQDREGHFIRANTVAVALKLRDKIVSQILRELKDDGKLTDKRNDSRRIVYCYKPKESVKEAINSPRYQKPFTPYKHPI